VGFVDDEVLDAGLVEGQVVVVVASLENPPCRHHPFLGRRQPLLQVLDDGAALALVADREDLCSEPVDLGLVELSGDRS